YNRRRRGRRRAEPGGNGSQGAAADGAELCCSGISRATLVAIQSWVHGGHYKEGCERCKRFSSSKTGMIFEVPSRQGTSAGKTTHMLRSLIGTAEAVPSPDCYSIGTT